MPLRVLIAILLFSSSSFLFAKNTIITGTAKPYSGMTIRLVSYTDLISQKEEILASSEIDDMGNFRLVFDISKTTFAFLDLDFRKSEIYIIPGCFYTIDIKKSDKEERNVNPFLKDKNLEYSISRKPDEDINEIIQNINIDYNSFIADKNNFYALYRKRDKRKIKEFRDLIEKNYPGISNHYVQNIIRFRIASLEDLAKIKSRKKLFSDYFNDQDILYDHIEYMEFFKQFFHNYLISSLQIENNELIDAVENKKDYYYLLDIMGRDTLLKNELLRELVMLQGLNDLSGNIDFNQNNIITILKEFRLNTRFQEHKDIAGNLVSVMTNLKAGTKAPSLSITNAEGDVISLNDFKGKYIYLFFWTTWCTPCTKEFTILSELYTIYKNEIEFLGISCDKEYSSTYHFLNEKKYPWRNLYLNNDLNIIDNYQIRSYPTFVLIDKKGNIIRYPAPMPSQKIERLFGRLLLTED